MDTQITKQYFDTALKGLITREYFDTALTIVNNSMKDLVTKEDLDVKLKKFATKDDLKNQLHDQKVELMEYIDDRLTSSEDKIMGMTARALNEIRDEMSV